MVDFIYMGLLELQLTQWKREIQNENLLPIVGFEPGTFRFQRKRANNYV